MSWVDTVLGRIARSVCRDRKRWALAFFVCALLASFSVSRMKLTLDVKDFLPRPSSSKEGRDSEKLQKQVLAQFGGKAPAVIVLRGDKKIELDSVAPMIEDLAHQLETIDEVETVTYRMESRFKSYVETELKKKFLLYLSLEDLSQFSENIGFSKMKTLMISEESGRKRPSALLRRDPLGLLNLARPYIFDLLAGFRIAFVDGYLASRDQRAFFILVTPKNPIRKAEDAKAFTKKIDRTLSQIRGNEQYKSLLNEILIKPIGRSYIYVSTFDATMRDSQQASIYSAISIFLLMILLFRRFNAAFIVMLPVVFGLLMTAAVGALIFPSVNIFSLLFASVLAGLGVDFAIHIGTHYWFHSTGIQNQEEAVAQAIIRPGRGILFGALTTAAAFSALAFSQYSGISQTGILTGIGILMMFIASMTVLPYFIVLTKQSLHAPKRMRRWTHVFVFLSERFPRTGLVIWGFLLIAASFGVLNVRYEDHPWSVAVRGNKKAEDLLDLNKRIGMSFTPILLVSRGETELEAIEKDREVANVLRRIRKEAGIAFFQSITSLLPGEGQQRENIAFISENQEIFSPERFRHDFHEILKEGRLNSKYLSGSYTEQIANVLAVSRMQPIRLEELKASGLGSEIERHLGRIENAHLAITYVYLKKFPWVKGAVTAFTTAFESEGGHLRDEVFLVGEGMQSVSHAKLLKREVIQVGSIALALVTLLIGLAFKRPSSIVMTLLPLVASVWITLGMTGFLGIELNFLTLSITPILLGIGIDDGLHIMERYRREASIRIVLEETGSGITATSLTTSFAFLSFCFAEYEVVRDFGWVASIGIGLCLFASLHLLPCLFALRKR